MERFMGIYHNLVEMRRFCYMFQSYSFYWEATRSVCLLAFPPQFLVVLQRTSRPPQRLQRSSLCPGWPLPKTLWMATCWVLGSSTGPTCLMEVHIYICTPWDINCYVFVTWKNAGEFTLALTLAFAFHSPPKCIFVIKILASWLHFIRNSVFFKFIAGLEWKQVNMDRNNAGFKILFLILKKLNKSFMRKNTFVRPLGYTQPFCLNTPQSTLRLD